MKYEVIRTETADVGIRKIILYVAQNFGNSVALEKLDELEKRIVFHLYFTLTGLNNRSGYLNN